MQLPKDKSSDAQWLEAPERGGAEGVEELALEAVQQLKLAGWDVARDLQAPPPFPSLRGTAVPWWLALRRCAHASWAEARPWALRGRAGTSHTSISF